MAKTAFESGKYNVAFEAYYLLAEPDNCIDVLIKAKRIAEAAIFAKAYVPSRISELIPLWSKSLKD
jgi:coatomer subunit beta'